MTDDEIGRIEGLEARVMALQIAVTQLAHFASDEAKAAIAGSAEPAYERALALSLTDRQIDLMHKLLLSMR